MTKFQDINFLVIMGQVEVSQEDFTRPESIGGDTLTCKQVAELRGPTFDPLDDEDLFN